jgi:hypothetical protein
MRLVHIYEIGITTVTLMQVYFTNRIEFNIQEDFITTAITELA